MHIFYINLSSRPDRRAFMEHQADRLGLSLERIEAVTPDDIPASELAFAAQWLGKGELACSYSHRAAWRLILERGLSAALILEDDCTLSPELPAVLADPDLMSPGIDMLQLETHPSHGVLGRPLPTASQRIAKRRMMSSCLGTCGYVMTSRLAAECEGHPDLPKMDLGKFLFSRNGPGFLYRHRVFQTFPALATPIGALVPDDEIKRSDIDWTRRKRDPALADSPRRRSRMAKLTQAIEHAGRAMSAFGLGELLLARHVDIPFAGEAVEAKALLAQSALT